MVTLNDTDNKLTVSKTDYSDTMYSISDIVEDKTNEIHNNLNGLNKKIDIMYDNLSQKYSLLYNYVIEINKSHTLLLNDLEKEKNKQKEFLKYIKHISLWQRLKLFIKFIKKGDITYGV